MGPRGPSLVSNLPASSRARCPEGTRSCNVHVHGIWARRTQIAVDVNVATCSPSRATCSHWRTRGACPSRA
eukprot:2257111-Prymnesium_polylepis.1